MAKSKNPYEILKQKENKLNWSEFNFLENLLIFCTEPTRRVPHENGMCFVISATPKDKSICILFKTDRNDLIKEGKKPDYMALYIKENKCICTIIEMKGGKGNEDGIDQIIKLKDLLEEKVKHLPKTFKVKFQGILLIPPTSQIPGIKINKVKDFEIVALQSFANAELFPYISKLIRKTDLYKKGKPRKNNLNFIEEILMKQALPERIKDSFYHKYSDFIYKKEGIYINYAHPEMDNYAVLFANNDDAVIAASEDNFRKQIHRELKNIGGEKNIHFEKSQP